MLSTFVPRNIHPEYTLSLHKVRLSDDQTCTIFDFNITCPVLKDKEGVDSFKAELELPHDVMESHLFEDFLVQLHARVVADLKYYIMNGVPAEMKDHSNGS